MSNISFDNLINYIRKVPSIEAIIGNGVFDNGLWWIKFQINIEHPLAWQVVQEIGHVVNYLSLDEKLPTTFYPVSAPPYMNGGPKDYLYWVIESTSIDFTPDLLREWLEGRLPRPVDDLNEWNIESEDE